MLSLFKKYFISLSQNTINALERLPYSTSGIPLYSWNNRLHFLGKTIVFYYMDIFLAGIFAFAV